MKAIVYIWNTLRLYLNPELWFTPGIWGLPTLWGDGVHNDSPAIQALVDGKVVREFPSLRLKSTPLFEPGFYRTEITIDLTASEHDE